MWLCMVALGKFAVYIKRRLCYVVSGGVGVFKALLSLLIHLRHCKAELSYFGATAHRVDEEPFS